MAEKLFYGYLSSVNPIESNNNSFNRINFNSTSGSPTITDVIANGSFAGLDLIYIGMQMDATGVFSDAIITEINGDSITFDVNATATKTDQTGLGRVSPGPGQYFIPSASLYDPAGQQTVRSITGSNDSTFDGISSIYSIVGPASNSSNNAIAGRFYKYDITDIPYKSGNTEFSILINYAESGSSEPNNEKLLVNS